MNAQTPFDMDRAVAVARETMEELSTLLEVENQALRQRRLDAVRDELERKERLTRNLEVVLSGLKRDRQRFAEHAARRPGLKEQLQERWNALAGLAAENAEILKGAQELAQAAVDLVVEAARKAQTQVQGGYAKGYGRGGYAKPVVTRPPSFSVALDKSF
jgi:hypothetical protein